MPSLLFFFIAALVLSGVALIGLGLFDRQQEAAEYNMAQRLERVSTARNKRVSVEDLDADRDFAKFEEERMRKSQRRTTYLPTVSEYAAKNNWVMRLEEELIQVRSQWRATELLAGSIFLAVLVLVVALVLGPEVLVVSHRRAVSAVAARLRAHQARGLLPQVRRSIVGRADANVEFAARGLFVFAGDGNGGARSAVANRR